MRIHTNTPDRLILKNVPWVVGIAIISGILGLTAWSLQSFLDGAYTRAIVLLLSGPGFLGVFFVIFVRRDDLILDRIANTIELRHATVFGRRKVRHDLYHLKEAIVQSNTGSVSHGSAKAPTHRVALVLDGGMDAGTHPVTEVYYSGNAAERAAHEINGWLMAPVDSLRRKA